MSQISKTNSRRQSRELALQILFQIEFAPQIQYSEFLEVFEQSFGQDVIDYADLIINGVKNNSEKIDSLLQSASQHWKVDRMAIVDRNLLRMAIFEMRMMSDPLQPSIVMNEAIELGKKYGSTDSSSFINGLLDQIAKEAR